MGLEKSDCGEGDTVIKGRKGLIWDAAIRVEVRKESGLKSIWGRVKGGNGRTRYR